MRRFRVKIDSPHEKVSFNTPSITPQARGEEFETADWRFLCVFDAGQIEYVEEVAPVEETGAVTSKKGKSG